MAGLGYMVWSKRDAPQVAVQTSPVPAAAPGAPVAAGAPTASTATPVAAAAPAVEPGTMIISALGLADPKDPRFNGDAEAARAAARSDARRQLVDKALALYVDRSSLDKNYAVIEQKLMPRSSAFIKTVIHEGAPAAGKDGLIESETRAVVKVRDVQKSLNQMSKDDRIDFIRNNGDPRISILMVIRDSDSANALPPGRSQLAENMVKERVKSFGFRVWSPEGDVKTGPSAKTADFEIQGEVRVKQLSARLAASGLTVTKTALTSWTVKAIDKATGEEIYLNTISPKARSWATEDQALAEIGKLVGDEFSKNFFLQHFNFGAQPIRLKVAGLPDARSAQLVLRELRGIRQVLDAQLAGRFGHVPGAAAGRQRDGHRAGRHPEAAERQAGEKLLRAGRRERRGGQCEFFGCLRGGVRAGQARNGSAGGPHQRRGSPQQGAPQGHGLEDHLEAAFAPGERPGVQPRTAKSTVSSLDSAMLWPNVMRPWLRSITSSRRRAISASPANVTKVPLVL